MSKTIYLGIVLFGLAVCFTSCSKHKESTNGITSETETNIQNDVQSWTSDDLKHFLISAQKWNVDNSDIKDQFKEDGTFISGYDNKGEATIGKWNVLSPNTFELLYYGNIEKVVITSITSDSYTWGEHISKSENQQITNELKSRIDLFSELNIDNLVLNESDTNKYLIIDPKISKTVKTDDGSYLNIREYPVDGTIISRFSDGTRIEISQRTKEKYTIDGITDYWYYGFCYADVVPWGGWIFGGFLIDVEQE